MGGPGVSVRTRIERVQLMAWRGQRNSPGGNWDSDVRRLPTAAGLDEQSAQVGAGRKNGCVGRPHGHAAGHVRPGRRWGLAGCSGAWKSSQNLATEIKIRAGKRAGELLASVQKSKGGRPSKTTSRNGSSFPKVEELGFDHKQSHKFQRFAAVPDVQLETSIRIAWRSPMPVGRT